MNEMDRAKRLLAMAMGISLGLGGPYTDLGLRPPMGQPQLGRLVACHICKVRGVPEERG